MQVELAQFLTIIEDESVIIIDARPSAAFMLGYVPNAIHITPLTAKYAIAMDIIRKDSPLVFILEESIAAETLAYFTKAAFTDIKGYLEGGFATWAANKRVDLIIDVEVDISKGLNNLTIVGLGDKSVGESRDRVSSAIKNSGFKSPKQCNQKVVISLAPADFSVAARAFVITAGFDPLRDEGTAYARRLAEAGVAVTHECFEGQIHGYITMGGVMAAGTHALYRMAQSMRQAFPQDFGVKRPDLRV